MSLSYRLGIQNRKVTMNPARSVTHRREDNNRVRFLSDEEEKKLRKVVETGLAYPGIRPRDQYGNSQGQSVRSDMGHGRLEWSDVGHPADEERRSDPRSLK